MTRGSDAVKAFRGKSTERTDFPRRASHTGSHFPQPRTPPHGRADSRESYKLANGRGQRFLVETAVAGADKPVMPTVIVNWTQALGR